MTMYDRAAPRPAEFQFRANPDGSDTFVGYSAVFNSESQPLPFIETIDPVAFNRTLSSPRRKQFVVNHDDAKLVSSTDTGRLKLSPDSEGLLTESPLGKTSWGRDIRALADDGELWGMSFSFRAAKKGERWNDAGTHRHLLDVDLGHVTVLTGLEPAYHATNGRLQVRSLAEKLGAPQEDVEDLIQALLEGRELSDDQVASLQRYTVRKDADSEAAVEPDHDEWFRRFDEMAAFQLP